MALKPNNTETLQTLHKIISSIQNRVINTKSWMTDIMLQLNMNNAQVLVLMNKSLCIKSKSIQSKY